MLSIIQHARRALSNNHCLRIFDIATRTCSNALTSRFPVDNSGSKMPTPDRLYTKVELEIRGHDKAVLGSYISFLKAVCQHLDLSVLSIVKLPYVRWLQNTLRAKFAKKKNQLHYETRTYIRLFTIANVTGSTGNTFLEYVQRNLPEGVGMKVTYNELLELPEMVRQKMIERERHCANVVDEKNSNTVTDVS